MASAKNAVFWNAWRPETQGSTMVRRGKVVEWAGVPGSGKTTLLQAMLELQGQQAGPPFLQTFSGLMSRRLRFADRTYRGAALLARGMIWPGFLKRLRKHYYERILLSSAKLDFLYMNPALFRNITEFLEKSQPPVTIARDIDWLNRAFANYELAAGMLDDDDLYVEDEGMVGSVACVLALAHAEKDAVLQCARRCANLFPPIDLLVHVQSPHDQIIARLMQRDPHRSLNQRLAVADPQRRQKSIELFAAAIECLVDQLRVQGARVLDAHNDGSRSPTQIGKELLAEILA